MTVRVVLEFEDEVEAKKFVGYGLNHGISMATGDWPEDDTPIDLNVIAVFKRPTKFCDASDGHRSGRKTYQGWTRGKKYGWWVHVRCGKPKAPWTEGAQWYAMGTNLLPLALLERLGFPDEYRPQGWKSPQSWTFLLDENEHDWDYSRGTKWCYDHNQPLEKCKEK